MALLLLLELSSAPAAIQRPAGQQAPSDAISYRCGDLVVIGRFENLNYAPVAIEDDIIGHGWMTARIAVSRVLAGHRGRGALRVRYFGHTYYRPDRDFMLVIGSARQSTGFVRSAHLIDEYRPPRLAPACG